MGGKAGSRVIRTVQAGGGSGFGEDQEGGGGDDRRAKEFCCDLQVESQGLADMWRGWWGGGVGGVREDSGWLLAFELSQLDVRDGTVS